MLRVWALLVLSLIGGGRAVAQKAAQPAPAPTLLALYSDDRLLPANILVDESLRLTLGVGRTDAVAYYSEFLEAARFPGDTHRGHLRDYLRATYQAHPPGVVFAGGRPALEFLLDNRQDLFAGVPIVFAGLSESEIPRERLDANVIGLAAQVDFAPAVELALRLQPDTTHVVVVAGSAERERALRDRLKAVAVGFEGRLTFISLTDLPMAELQQQLSALPPHTVVLYSTLFRDGAGQSFVPVRALELLSAASSAPIYGSFETYVGSGAVGGTLQTWEDTGSKAGAIALRVLAGEDPQHVIQGQVVAATTIVDWRQMRRWHIPEANLPPGTVIRFREPTFWETYWKAAALIAAVGIAQLSLITWLAVALQRRRQADATRLRAEARAAQLRGELNHATRVTTMGELAATLAHELNQPLAAILSNAQAARRWLAGSHPDLDEIRAIVGDIITDDKRAGEIIHRMRAMLRKSDHKRAPIDLARVVQDTAALLNSELVAANVRLMLNLPAEPLVVDADEVETQQVLLNLMKNGIDAIADNGMRVRELRVSASRPHNYAVVTVHDTGGGMSDDTRARLFDPFFTTKAKGLGMGLAICRRIAEAHGGKLDVGAASEGGATLVLSLPLAAPSA